MYCKAKKKIGAIRKFLKFFIFENLLHKKRLKGGISIYADFGPPRYVLWCCSGICHEVLTFFQIGCGHTVWSELDFFFQYNGNFFLIVILIKVGRGCVRILYLRVQVHPEVVLSWRFLGLKQQVHIPITRSLKISGRKNPKDQLTHSLSWYL